MVCRSTAQLLHMEDKDFQRKEQALRPGSKTYYSTVRTGICNAYLAASVVSSSLVGTSKTGGMGMVSADFRPEYVGRPRAVYSLFRCSCSYVFAFFEALLTR